MSGVMNMLLGARTAIAAAVDEFFNRVTLLLPGDGTNGTHNNTFLDSGTANSGSGFNITRNPSTGPNAPTQGTFSPFSQTGWSNYFDGTDDRLSVPDNAKIELGSAAFTIECFAYNTAWDVDQNQLFEKGSFSVGKSYRGWMTATAIVLEVNVSGSATGAYTTFTASTTNNLNQWYHVAFVRSGNSIYIFKDGVQVGSTGTLSGTAFDTSQALSIGGAADGNNNIMMNGYISNFRIITGQAIATGTFTPPTATLQTSSTGWVVSGSPVSLTGTVALLICQSNRFVDNSASPLDITVGGGSPSVQAFSPFAPTAAYSAATVGGSGYFDGTGDYLSVPDDVAFTMGAGDFCLEAWVYVTSNSGSQTIFGTSDSSGTPGSVSFILQARNTSGFPIVYVGYAGALYSATSSEALVPNQWTHIAGVRNGATVSIYVNGKSRGTLNMAALSIADSTQIVGIGRNGNFNGEYLTGYISGARIVKGSPVYTADFTPPTAPPTAITNTSLLLNFTNAGITDATAKNDLETIGNAQISTAQSKFGGSSMSFDGTNGTYLSVKGSSAVVPLGSGDFTIEFWIYFNTGAVASRILMDYRPLGTEGLYPTLFTDSSSQLTYYTNSANRIVGGTLSATSWTHIALCRASGSTRLFINGTQSGSTYTDANNYLSATDRPFVGMSSRTANDGMFSGYIDDLRITRFARYTTTFTAPTAAFPLQ